VAVGQDERPLCLGELSIGAAVFAQGVWRRVFERHAIGFVAQLLEITHQCLEAMWIATVGTQHALRARVERARVFAWRLWSAFPRDGSALLSPRHSVPAPTARAAAAAIPAAVVPASLLEAVRAVDGLVAARLERDLGFFATTRACGAEHLALAASA
jgi:hypothetical protein